MTKGEFRVSGRMRYVLLVLRFLLNMMSLPEMIRNVAVVGHLHHGKTALLDMLVFETHKLVWDADKPVSGLYVIYFQWTDFEVRQDTLTHIPYLVRERSPSNLHQCHLYCLPRRENPI